MPCRSCRSRPLRRSRRFWGVPRAARLAVGAAPAFDGESGQHPPAKCGASMSLPIQRHDDVTPAVLEVMARTRDPRLREILTSLIKHLHGFVREVRLTEAEFR